MGSLDQLAEYLAAARWKKADVATGRLIYEAVGEEGPIYDRHLPSIEPELLRDIDGLWRAHSHQRFGFRPQAAAWERAGGDYALFATFLGWRRRNAYIMYAAANFDLSAPEGHLPIGGPEGIVFEDEIGLSIPRELGEMLKATYRDLGERRGALRAGVLVARSKLLRTKDPPRDFGNAMEWVGGRPLLLSRFREAAAPSAGS
jgi:GUN4-like